MTPPDGAYLIADRVGVISDPPGTPSNRGWLWSDAPVGAGPGLGAAPFRAPSVSLPMGGHPVLFSLHTKRGRQRTEPAPPGTIPPALGFDEAGVAELSIALHPRVLVLPVRIHRFVAEQMEPDPRISARLLSQFLDPGAVATQSVALVDGAFESRVEVVSGSLPPLAGEPDSIWTQCDIQFHLELFDEVVQPDGLESRLTQSCICGNTGIFGVTDPLSGHLSERGGREAIDVLVGGDIEGRGCPFGRVHGITCGPSNSEFGGTCSRSRLDGHPHNIVLLRERSIREVPNLMAHELGHILGLRHPGEGEQCLEPDDTMEGERDMLMLPGGGPSEPRITAAQCARARCMAARWLNRFERLSDPEMNAICGGN